MSIASLGYVGFKASDLSAWRTFATDVLGLMPAAQTKTELRFRLDARAWRIAVEDGPEDDIAYAGFEVAGPAELAAIVDRLSKGGVTVVEASPELRQQRGVVGLVTCLDPEGLPIEIYFGPTELREHPFVSAAGVSAFATGDQGLGHIVLATKDIVAARGFYVDLLGFRLSDIIRMQLSPDFGFDIEFYHCNARHHTLALLPVPVAPKRLHHFMVQAAQLDDVGFALDRIAKAGIALTNSLGKHSNDEMVSFYAQTPSGFEVEYGWGARNIDADWRVVRHDRISSWGHQRLA